MRSLNPLAALLILGGVILFSACENPTTSGDSNTESTSSTGVAMLDLQVGFTQHNDGDRLDLEPGQYVVTRGGNPIEVSDGFIEIPADPAGAPAPIVHTIQVTYTDPEMGTMVHQPLQVVNEDGTARVCMDAADTEQPTCALFPGTFRVDLNVDATGLWTCIVNDDVEHWYSGVHNVEMLDGHVARGFFDADLEVDGCTVDDIGENGEHYVASFVDSNTLVGSIASAYDFVCTR